MGAAVNRRNLVLIHRGPAYQRDFTDIARRVTKLDRTISVYHLPVKLKAELPEDAWQYPTLTLAFSRDFLIPIRRGPILRNQPAGKLAQQEIFRRNGIPTPDALPFHFGMKLDPARFGELVILKPMDLASTSHGEGVRLFRRSRLETLSPAALPNGHPAIARPGSFMVQRFIPSGRHPWITRVQTFLGRALYCYEVRVLAQQPPLDAGEDALENYAAATNAAERSRVLVDDRDAIRLAEAVHRALPGVPMLGVDMIRDAATGTLWVLECNAGGNTWHFSSEIGQGVRDYLGAAAPDPAARSELGRQMLIDQFGAFDIAARLLARATDQHAA